MTKKSQAMIQIRPPPNHTKPQPLSTNSTNSPVRWCKQSSHWLGEGEIHGI